MHDDTPAVPPNLHDYLDNPPSPPTITSLQGPASEFDMLIASNAFRWDPDPTVKFIPIVNSHFELLEHFAAHSIPSPVGLWQEQENIGR